MVWKQILTAFPGAGLYDDALRGLQKAATFKLDGLPVFAAPGVGQNPPKKSAGAATSPLCVLSHITALATPK